MRKIAIGLSIVSCVFALACATPVVKPVDVSPVTPAQGQSVSVDQSIVLVDSSGSISRREQFPNEKALVSRSCRRCRRASTSGRDRVRRRRASRIRLDVRSRRAQQLRGRPQYLSDGTPLDQRSPKRGRLSRATTPRSP
jgi:hypothetical protein